MAAITPQVGSPTPPEHEFDRQLQRLLGLGYARLAGLTERQFIASVDPLRAHLASIRQTTIDVSAGVVSFVIVVTSTVVATEKAMPLVKRGRLKGIIALQPREAADFQAIDRVTLPTSGVYLLAEIDRGDATRNVRPEDAMKLIRRRKRSPLTIDEGIAILTQHPGFLIKNHCFSLLASRCGDQRVPALWISERRAKLGWCWDRNPHTWLGSASCRRRLG